MDFSRPLFSKKYTLFCILFAASFVIGVLLTVGVHAFLYPNASPGAPGTASNADTGVRMLDTKIAAVGSNVSAVETIVNEMFADLQAGAYPLKNVGGVNMLFFGLSGVSRSAFQTAISGAEVTHVSCESLTIGPPDQTYVFDVGRMWYDSAGGYYEFRSSMPPSQGSMVNEDYARVYITTGEVECRKFNEIFNNFDGDTDRNITDGLKIFGIRNSL